MEQWLSIIDYARHYQVSDMTIRRRIKTGRLPAVLRDGKYYIPVSELSKNPDRHLGPGATSVETMASRGMPNYERLETEERLPQRPVAMRESSSSSKADRLTLDDEPMPSTLRAMEMDHLAKSFLVKLEQSIHELSNYRAELRDSWEVKQALYEEKLKAYKVALELKDSKILECESKIKDLEFLSQILEEKLETITSSYHRS